MPTYIAIDLKSFYGSVEAIERGLDPLTTNLVVADKSRTEKTICLAVTPSLKAHGIPGRPRLFEVVQKVREVNALRKGRVREFSGKSWDDRKLRKDPTLEVDYIVAKPRMALYMEYSSRIYQIYLRHVAPEDIHVYSVDEVMIDATAYLKLYNLTAHEFAKKMIQDVLRETGITATAGIGTNLYLCKVAMDIIAKHVPADKDGVRIGELDEMSYREKLWNHQPLTDFWRVGRGYAKKLNSVGLCTMGDIARCSLGRDEDFYNEELLYKMFGVNAELLIDHSWGWEPCTMSAIKSYTPEANSMGSGQVLQEPYPFQKARLVVREMADSLSLELAGKGLTTNQLVLDVGYDIENVAKGNLGSGVTSDRYGRKIPKPSHGSQNLPRRSSSTRALTDAALTLFDRIADPSLLVRRLNLSASCVLPAGEDTAAEMDQLSLFSAGEKPEEERGEKEKKIQDAILNIRAKYGKNALLKGFNLEEGATARERNGQIGGHKA